MKRWPGESFEDYKVRRSGNRLIEKAHLKGRVDGKYVDAALDKTMKKFEWRNRLDDFIRIVVLIMIPVAIIAIAVYLSKLVS